MLWNSPRSYHQAVSDLSSSLCVDHFLKWSVDRKNCKYNISLLCVAKSSLLCTLPFLSADTDRGQRHGMDEFISANPCRYDHASLFKVLQQQTLEHRLNDSYSCLVSIRMYVGLVQWSVKSLLKSGSSFQTHFVSVLGFGIKDFNRLLSNLKIIHVKIAAVSLNSRRTSSDHLRNVA